MSDLAKMLAENQNEMLKFIAPVRKKQPVHPNNQDFDSESENVNTYKNKRD